MTDRIRLTGFSHGGGCGCKIAPAVLERLLSELPKDSLAYPGLLVGLENGDDAAVYDLGNGQALVATTDFFMPIVDDAYDFGRIAATNALSDVYAMGAKPVLALALLAMPVEKLPDSVIRDIIRGGRDVCRAAGIPVAGGHSIDSVEPIYGLVAIGLGDKERIKRNDAAKPGDALILSKPVGIGILSAALKKEALSPDGYAAMIGWTTMLNDAGPKIAALDGVHAMTDVTGFALLGHLWEMARGSKLTAVLRADAVPVIPEALDLAQKGFVTGASGRNWNSYGSHVGLPENLPAWQQNLLTDPQTSGGLLIAAASDCVKDVLTTLNGNGAVIGHLETGEAGIRVT
jgi:selenide,water dikinase